MFQTSIFKEVTYIILLPCSKRWSSHVSTTIQRFRPTLCTNEGTLKIMRKMCIPSSSSLVQERFKSTKPDEEIDYDTPIKFSTSKAASIKSEQIILAQGRDAPWYERWVILFSIATFLIYFTVLREENDVDLNLSKSLYEQVPGLEEQQLEICLKHYKETGQDTRAIEDRLAELRALKT